jgi:hypothetical protein
MITAKPVIKNKFWILQNEEGKIGTVEKNNQGFLLRANGVSEEFKTIKTIKNRTNIVFEDDAEKQKTFENQVNGFPTDSKPHNAVYNVKERLPLFTKKAKSKSWYAAGYYQITINGQTETHFCPKVILLQRYPYLGPVHDPEGFYFK